MINSGCIIKVPGKLMIVGEYAVLEPGYQAVVVAVNRYVTAEIKPAFVNELSLPQLGLERITWNFDDKGVEFYPKKDRLSLVRNAMSTAFLYLKEKEIMLHPFQLHIKSDLNDPMTGKKYGLGSSAATVVAVIASILSFHGEYNYSCEQIKDETFTKDEAFDRNGAFIKDEALNKNEAFNKDVTVIKDRSFIKDKDHNKDGVMIKDEALMKLFKLSAIAHAKTQGNGSGADIAAVVYGGWIKYSTFGAKWLLTELKKESNITELIEMPWPDLVIGKLSPPEELKLLVGWTKESVRTAWMVKKIEFFQNENMDYYQNFLTESLVSVMSLIDAFEKGDVNKAMESLYKNRMALLALGERSGVKIETKRIKTLCAIADKFGRGKSSGAGGGDCGIAFIQGEEKYKELWFEWKKANILPLDILVAPKGCTVLRI